MTLCSRPYRGHMLSVQKLPLSKSVQIHNIGKLSQENIELYFESERNGGGAISDAQCDLEKGHAIVEFEKIDGW